MHKIQFARGIGQREMLRANTLPSITRAKVGCFARLGIYEENARFILTAILLVSYLCFGAVLFHYIEKDNEISERENFTKEKIKYQEKFCKGRSSEECPFEEFVTFIADGSAAGMLSERARFDFLGSLFFSATVVSTIGGEFIFLVDLNLIDFCCLFRVRYVNASDECRSSCHNYLRCFGVHLLRSVLQFVSGAAGDVSFLCVEIFS